MRIIDWLKNVRERIGKILLRSQGLYCSICDNYEVKVANRKMKDVVDLNGVVSIIERYDVTCVKCGETHVGLNLI